MGRIEYEIRVVEKMIRLYCRRHHGGGELCGECAGLLEYAQGRLRRCPKGENKTSCRRCEIHCYAPGQRRRIAAVMRYSGPRMLLYHPLTFLRHLLS